MAVVKEVSFKKTTRDVRTSLLWYVGHLKTSGQGVLVAWNIGLFRGFTSKDSPCLASVQVYDCCEGLKPVLGYARSRYCLG